ncbi:MAG: GNAT family N-acetyltransferase [Phycisphaerales bacterium]
MGDQRTPGIDTSNILPKDANFEVRPLGPEDRPWVCRVLNQYWASTNIYSKGRVTNAAELPGFAAFRDGTPVGLITYRIEDEDCEIVTHNSMAGCGGIGSCLLAAVRQEARAQGCKRLWLVTTNDNTPALRFYQRRDFDMVRIDFNAMQRARVLKPDIPERGLDDIPIRHEVELEYRL